MQRGELCAATFRPTTLGHKGVASLRGEQLQRRFRERYKKETEENWETHGNNLDKSGNKARNKSRNNSIKK